MARASAARVTQETLTRRGLVELSGLSMSAVQNLLTEACARRDFSREEDACDRRRMLLRPSPETSAIFTSLVGDFLLTATGDLSEAECADRAKDAQAVALYARFASALAGIRRPGGKLWVRPAALMMLGDLMVAGPKGVGLHVMRRRSLQRFGSADALDEHLALAKLAGLVESGQDHRLRLTPDGRGRVLEQIEEWLLWSAEARVMMATSAQPITLSTAAGSLPDRRFAA